MRRNLRNCCLACAALFLSTLAPVPAAARVYKWVDEKGQVHVESTVPPIDYEWSDRAGFYYNRDKVPGKTLEHSRPRAPAATADADAKPGAARGGASSAPGEAAYRRVEGLIAQAERQALAFDESEDRNRTSSTSSLDSAWTTWQRGFASQVDQVDQAVRADSDAPSSLGYALDSLRSLAHGGTYVPSKMTRESAVRSARSSLSSARAELDRRASARAAPAEAHPPIAEPAYVDEPHRVIVTAPMAMPSLAGMQGFDPNQAMAVAKTASMTASIRQAMAQVVMTGGCEGGYGGAPSTPGTWARKFVDDQNKAQREQAAEARKMMPPGAMVPDPVKFVYGAATAPWQVAVIPDVGTVRVEAYGADLKNPIQRESLPCGSP